MPPTGSPRPRRARAKIINLSFGSPDDCTTIFGAVQIAFAKGSLVVAAAGNEFAQGNPVIYPAAFPHVLSVAALDASLQASGFSSENTAVDVAAPGVDIPLAIPRAFDTDDGAVDGVTLGSGTSFAAPIVSGAAAWLATARPKLSNGQLADVLRRSARDVATPGYDPSTGFGLVQMGPALALPTPRARRARAQRRNLVRQRRGLQQGRPIRLAGRQSAHARRDGGQGRGPDRRLSRPAAQALAGADPAHAGVRQSRPLRLRLARDLDQRHHEDRRAAPSSASRRPTA